MPDVDEFVTMYNRIKWNEDDFVAIGLYRKITDEETLRFYYQLISKARFGYIVDKSRG